MADDDAEALAHLERLREHAARSGEVLCTDVALHDYIFSPARPGPACPRCGAAL